ncbi:hypothetical protein APSETT444_004112 [Aspergillus pseudonomiae]
MATPAALPPLPFNPARVRSYLLRLPLFTRLVVLAIIVFWLLEFQTVWSVVQWGSLAPDEVGLGSMYRLNTYPFIHNGFFHAFLNLVALTPLVERFEAEHGTLTAVALFFGLGLGYLKVFVPPEKILRWIEGKLNLLGRLPHYISVDQKTYGRYGVLPTTNTMGERGTPMSYLGSSQRLGP